MIRVRKENRAFGRGAFKWALTTNGHKLAAYWRSYQDELVLVLHNLRDSAQSIRIDVADIGGGQAPAPLLHNKKVGEIRENFFEVELDPLEFLWLKFR
jgi:hypothetical protein